MQDTDIETPRAEDSGILLADLHGSILLIEGEAHLDAMLTTKDGFPTPVRYIRIDSTAALDALLPDDVEIDSLWAIHPEIVARLEADGQLAMTALPDEA